MKVIFSTRANSDLVSIAEHIFKANPTAAITLTDGIIETLLTQLTSHPNSGRPGRVKGTRELVVHKTYIAAYRVTAERVEILTVRHTARLWPGAF